MITDLVNIVVREYVKKKLDSLKEENEKLKRELRRRTSIDVEYKVVEDLKKG